jgi:transketolase
MTEHQFLQPDLFSPDKMVKAATRNGYGDAVIELAKKNSQIVVLTADLRESMRVEEFAHLFSERFVEVGVAEQNLMGIAAGLALSGKIPFVSSYAVFSPGRSWDQLRVSVCYSKANVKVIGGHTGLSVGPDGATHQALEDIAITRCLPNLVVLSPCDANQARLATLAAAHHTGPVYMRISREAMPTMTKNDAPFQIGKAQVFRSGADVTLLATGPLVYEALVAAEQLAKENIEAEVINIHTIKPIDEEALIHSAAKTKAVVTIEDHQIMGGFGSAVAEVLAQHQPVPQEMIGVKNRFGQSGTATELLEQYSMTHPAIIAAAKKVIARKNH